MTHAPDHLIRTAQFPTNADRVCADAIAQALMDRYGHIRLTVRYDAARQAMDAAQAGVETEERFHRWLAEQEAP